MVCLWYKLPGSYTYINECYIIWVLKCCYSNTYMKISCSLRFANISFKIFVFKNIYAHIFKIWWWILHVFCTIVVDFRLCVYLCRTIIVLGVSSFYYESDILMYGCWNTSNTFSNLNQWNVVFYHRWDHRSNSKVVPIFD